MKRTIALALISLTLPVIPQRQAIAQYQTIPAAVSACYAQPLLCTVVAAGVGAWILTRNGRKILCTWDGCQAYSERQPSRIYTDEPDSHDAETWQEEVWVADPADAARVCRAKARNWSRRGNVTYIGSRCSKKKARGGDFRCICSFRAG
jgi:hypothetical protein